MAREKRENLGITLPTKTVAKLDRLRGKTSSDKEFRGKDRSAVIETLIQIGIEARANVGT